jgi:hypothetical protein
MDNLKKHKYLWIVIFIITLLMLLWSFYYLYLQSNIKVNLKDSETTKTANYIYNLIKKEWIDLKKPLIEEDKKDNKTLYINELFWQHELKVKSWSYEDCQDPSLNKIEKQRCVYKFFYHKYSKFLDQKWIVDYKLCDQIKDIFWVDNQYIKDSHLFMLLIYELNS